MTVVELDFRRPEKLGPVSASGRVEWRPTARRTEGDAVVLPATFSVQLVDGVASVDVAPSGLGWVWRVSEYVTGGATRYVTVPDVPTIAYTDLIDVDPATLEPSAEPTAAWWAALEQAQIGIYATAVPGHPELVEIHYPVWGTLPGHSNILIMPIQEAQP